MNDKETYDYLIVNYILQLYYKVIDVNNFKMKLKQLYCNDDDINPDNLNDDIVYFSIFFGLCFIDFTTIFIFLQNEKANELYSLFIKEILNLCNEEFLINNFITPMKLAYEKDIIENTIFDYRLSTLWKCITYKSKENTKIPNLKEMIFLLDYMKHWQDGIAKTYLHDIGYIKKYGLNKKNG